MHPDERFKAWIVDDSPLELEGIRRALSGSFDIQAFSDGPEFLEHFTVSEPPDVVLLDWMLPAASGPELCRFLRERWDEAELPVLILTARGEKSDVIDALEAGANDYVAKPYAQAELAARVSVLARLRRSHRRALEAEAEVRRREESFRQLADNLPDVVARFDRQRRHLYVNPTITRISGLQPQNLIGKTNAELGMPLGLVDRWDMAIDATFQGQVTSLHFEFPGPEGTSYFHNTLVPERDDGGHVVSVLCISRNETEQVRNEQALREGKEQLRLALAAGDIGTWELTLPERRLRWDLRASTLFDMGGDSEVDLDAACLRVHPQERDAVRAGFEAALAGGVDQVCSSEFRVVDGSGAERWLAMQGRVIGDARGRGERLLGVVRDITESRRQVAEAQQMAEFEQTLMAIVGHDLRNPLNAILLSTALLEQRLEAPPLQRKAHLISMAAKRASRIIHDLMDLTRTRRGSGIPVNLQPCDLHPVIREVVDEHQAAYPQRDIRLRMVGQAMGTWDGPRLAQVAANLLSNALLYSPEGTPVEVTVESEDMHLVLSIRNEGAPIPTKLVPNLFTSFKQGSESSQRSGGGLGLGLYIAERIVTAHQGRIVVESNPEQGTRFSVRLPMQPGEPSSEGAGASGMETRPRR